MFGRKAHNDTERKNLIQCYKTGMKNGWASGKHDKANGNYLTEEDRLNLNSICFIDTVDELKEFFIHGNWMIGQGIIHAGFFFLNQVNGGDEWATYKISKKIFQFESVSFIRVIEDNEFEDFLFRIKKADDIQLANCEY